MHYATIPGIDRPLSRLIQGTVMMSPDKQGWSFDLLDGVFALGCATFDTAHNYQMGRSERLLGQWIHERGVRDRVVIVSKGAHPYDGRVRVTPTDITSDLYDSLERLQTDWIDLYLLHRDNPAVPVGPLVEVLNEHHAAGKIRRFGGSNWSHRRIQDANEYAEAHGLMPFAASSPNFSLARQFKEPWPGCVSISHDAEARAWYHQNQIPIIAWSSLAGGFFSGRFRRDNLDTFSDYFDLVCKEAYCYEDNFQRLDRAEQMAKEKGVSLAQIAMAAVVNQPLNIFAVVGCQTPDEFAANTQALDLKLTADEIAWLEA
jgi:aryl-alcohol dehydrogenase-like predicted oxidoreductase